MRRREALGIAWVLALAVSTEVHAESRVFSLTDVTTISNGAGDARILFRMDRSETWRGLAIRRVLLSFPLAGQSEARRMGMRVHAIESPWAPESAGWTEGWARPGGDFDVEVYGRASVDLERPTVVADVTNVVSRMVRRPGQHDGLIVTVDPHSSMGIPADDVQRFARLDEATITVTYRRVGRYADERPPRQDPRRGVTMD